MLFRRLLLPSDAEERKDQSQAIRARGLSQTSQSAGGQQLQAKQDALTAIAGPTAEGQGCTANYVRQGAQPACEAHEHRVQAQEAAVGDATENMAGEAGQNGRGARPCA